MDIIMRANELLNNKVPFCLVTVVTSNVKDFLSGQKAIILDDGTIVGTFGSEQFDQKLCSYARIYLQQKKSGITWFEDKLELFFNVIAPETRLIICGAGHIAVPLAQFTAQAGFQVTVLDDRPDFANESRFPCCKVIAEDFTIALNDLTLGPNTFAVVITRGHEHDIECLQVLLKKKLDYVGLIGSHRRVRIVLEMLKSEGIPQKRLNEVFTPIGIPIGAESPAEIAISIVSELVCVRRKGWQQARALRAAIGVDK
ncbi:MAG: XdhC family protein [Deltaproteobacteria bacterium]|nr:XdhC family protein [Deltaproteobacteria bacterium]